MPSLQESVTPDAEYVNTDVISEIIKQDDNKSVAEISIQKEENHVCNIKIKDESKPIPKPNQAKRSVSSVSSSRPAGLKVHTPMCKIFATSLQNNNKNYSTLNHYFGKSKP